MKVYSIFILVLAISLLSGGCLKDDSTQSSNTAPPQVQAPVLALSDIMVTIGPTTANATWTTNVPADSMVRYGMVSGKYTMSEGSRDYVTKHNITIEGLMPGSTYYIKVGSVTPDGAASQSSEFNFTTIPLPPPEIFDLSISTTPATALIKWTTDIPSDSIVKYGIMSGIYNMSNGGEDYVSEHSVTLANLLPGSTYFYKVVSTDPNGVFNETKEFKFKTPPAKLREKITTDGLEIKIKDFGDYSVERGEIVNYYSKVEIEIKNAGEEKIPLIIGSTAIVDNMGYQSDIVTIGAPDEFKATEIFPDGKIVRALYYEKIKGSSGTLYMSINSKPYQFHVT